ncbi:MAG: putative selenate reductase subunit YgfK [Clostridium sp.]|nr:putative selenate reductase subunit YgfK [Clostridium sp.]
MSDIMTPIPFGNLMERMLQEYKSGSVFGMHKCWKADPEKYDILFGRKLESRIGPAAGPNTQLAQNIIASYYGGARFFELKTVQKMDGRELAAAVNKPCIKAEDECYNCEWSTELTVQQAFDEYVKAYFALKVIAKEWGLGCPDGFQFNISVGYDLEGIKTEKVNSFIDNIRNAENTPIFQECREWLLAHSDAFSSVTEEDIRAISPEVVNSATVSTLHGCPPQEIESIASYLITEKHLHTFVKCNPTLLGYEEARSILDSMGYDYIQFTDFHFKDDLQYADAVPMLSRLQKLAAEQGLEFGVKITNTFPVDVKNHELPSEEMYMSGKSLYPLSLTVARNLSRSFEGKLRISYSGGCDYFNIDKVIGTGIWPVTMATTLLKPGGYTRLVQMAQKLACSEKASWSGIDVAALEKLTLDARTDKHHVKPVKPLPKRKSETEVPLVDCFTSPCSDRCPIHQDITMYGRLVSEGNMSEALRVILDKNPLPFITGNICTHACQTACTRNFYETPVQIRNNKLAAARGGYEEVYASLAPGKACGKKVAVVGAGPAGIASAYFLGRDGADVTVFDENETAGGVVANIIPAFRLPQEEIQKDVALAKAVGAKFVMNTRVSDVRKLMEEGGYDAVILAIGAHQDTALALEEGEAMNALDFLGEFRKTEGKVSLGKNVVIVGGGNTAMDAARAALRNEGVEKVYLAYRRTAKFMPADEDELNEAIADGVEFCELVAPKTLAGGKLICSRMVLAEPDASGRRSVKETDETVEIPCDTVIASIGEKVDVSFYEANGIEVNGKGLPVLQADTNETSVPGIYAAGDGAFGASVVVKAIANAQKACEAILNHEIGEKRISDTTDGAVYEKKGVLAEAPEAGTADERCLSCDHICETCTDVCPNRANVAVRVPGREMHQIIHIDYMCNECGNCATFCPYASAPYKDKFTLFASQKDLAESENDGFVFLNRTGDAIVRVGGNEYSYHVGEKNSKVFFRLAEIVDAVYRDYNYLIL